MSRIFSLITALLVIVCNAEMSSNIDEVEVKFCSVITSQLDEIVEKLMYEVTENNINVSIQESTIYDYSQSPEDWPQNFIYYKGEILNRKLGKVIGPSGVETYYNLPMRGVVSIMQNSGYSYEYWVREDGCKMYGDYIMLAADLNIRPRGTILKTSLGLGIVCDTGLFVYSNPYQIDVAVTW